MITSVSESISNLEEKVQSISEILWGSEKDDSNIFKEPPNYKFIGWEGLVGDSKTSWEKIIKNLEHVPF